MVRKTVIKRKNNKKKNYTRRKKGGNGSGIFSFFGFTNKTEPDPIKTKEFVDTFKKHIKKIMDHQSSNNNEKLSESIEKLLTYINNLPKDIDREVRLEIPKEQEEKINPTSIRGLPIYIIGRIVKNENDRTRLKTALENKGFIYDKTVFNAIITKDASVKREGKQTDEPVENIPTPDEVEKQNQQRKEERRIIEEETIKREQEQRIEQEKIQKLLEEAEKRKIKEARIFKEEQEKEAEFRRANTQRMKEKEKQKKLKEAETFKKNTETIIKKQQENSKIIIQPINVEKIVRTKKEIEQQNINIDNVRIAETNDKYLKALLGIKDNNNIIIEEPPEEVKEETTKEVKEETTKEVKEVPKEEVKKEIKESVQLVKIPKIIKHTPYDTNAKPEYWKRFFPNEEIYFFRDYMLSMLHDIPLLYQITSDFFPAFTIDETNNKYINALIKDTKNITQQQMIEYIQNFETHLRFILLFIGIMSSIMQQYSCNLVLKGGKAIQMNCVIPYQSNDIDILVVSNEINKKEIAIEISKLLIWMISQQTILNNMSMIEIDKAEPIIKLSIYTRYGFEAVVDIGINDPKEEIKSYVTDVILTKPVALEFNYSISQSIMIYRAYPLQFISQSVDGMIKEKLYYYLKYVVLKKFTEEDNVEIFIPKIYRSLNALFGCIDKTRNFFKKLSGIINVVINEKKKYLTDLSTITIEDKEGIVNDILIKTNSA